MVKHSITLALLKTTWLMESGRIQPSQLILLLFTGMIKLANNLKLIHTDKLLVDSNGRDHQSFKKKEDQVFGEETESKLELLSKVTLVTAGSYLLLPLLQKLQKELEMSSEKIHTMTMVHSKLTCSSEVISKFKSLLMIEFQLDGMVQTIQNHSYSLTTVFLHKVLGG